MSQDSMESNINRNYPVIFLALWALLWLPYFKAFLLGNPPIEAFSLYDLVNSNIVVKIVIGSIAVFSELALVAAVIACIRRCSNSTITRSSISFLFIGLV